MCHERCTWMVAALASGLLFVGTLYGLIWFALPERGIARDWLIYMPLLFGPYAISAVGCRRSTTWLVRSATTLVLILGGCMVTAALVEHWQVFQGDTPPAMPGSAFLACFLLFGQYLLSIVTFVAGPSTTSQQRA